MAKVISILDAPLPKSNVYGTEIRKFGADGIVTILRRNPGNTRFEHAIMTTIDGTRVYGRTLDTEIKDELVSRFWLLPNNQEMHEFISPSSLNGTVEIRSMK